MNGLRAFEASGRRLSFRAAANELGVTQGAVAQQVRNLEAALDVTLFERRARGVSFTSAGRSYHQEVSAAFDGLRQATARVLPELSKVTISVTPTFASRWLIPNLPDFTDQHPDIDFRILATERVLSFDGDGIDLAVRQGCPPFGAQFDAELLFQQLIIAVAAPTLIPDASDAAATEALARLPLLHDTHNLWPEFLRSIGSEDGEPGQRNLHFSQTVLSIEAALSGQGIALASRFLVERDLEAGRLVQIAAHVFHGANGFYLLTGMPPRRQAPVEIVREWLSAQADGQA